MQGVVVATEEWKCLYSPKADVLQPCNTFGCPGWLAQEWSPVGALSLLTASLPPPYRLAAWGGAFGLRPRVSLWSDVEA